MKKEASTQCRGRFIVSTADLSARPGHAHESAVGCGKPAPTLG
ncbi:MAG TPA: hypothetical protein VEV19_15050 [Ktedonobacteraceae bacterium]|nr:hypothetical protein [Ktedonobacteraceae bacterium]